MYHAINYNEIDKFLKKYEYFDFILDRYNRSLCEINPKSKLLILWSLIEELFFIGKNDIIKIDIKSNSLLSKNEKKEFKKMLTTLTIPEHKIKKIRQRVCELKETDRNSVIAKNISNYLHQEFDEIKQKFQFVAKTRGNQAHTTEKSAKDVLQSINFLQNIVEEIIDRLVYDKL